MNITEACPICTPQAFDGSVVTPPPARICQVHQGHPLAEVFSRSDGYRSGTIDSMVRVQQVGGCVVLNFNRPITSMVLKRDCAERLLARLTIATLSLRLEEGISPL